MSMNGQATVMKPEIVELVQGAPTPEHVLEDAYQLWAWKHSQSSEKVADELGLHGKTVRRWAQAGHWRLRYEEERSELAPGLARYAAARQLQNALPGAISYVEAVSSGLVPADKGRLIACNMIIGSAGFAPIHYTGDVAKPMNAVTDEMPDLASMSIEEVSRREEEYRRKKLSQGSNQHR
jgi:hypothetical protein